MADPGTFTATLIKIGAWFFGASKTAWVARFIATVAITNALQKQPQISDTLTSRALAAVGGTEPKRIVYGETAFAAHIAYLNTAGDSLQDLYKVIVFAGHECEDITDVYFDDTLIPEADIDYGAGGGIVTGGIFVNYLWFSGTLVQPLREVIQC